MTSPLFSPITVGDLALSNRIVMAPLTRSRSNDEGVPPTFAADYYAQRAVAGLIITEATNISPQARRLRATPGIWSPAQVEAWQRVTTPSTLTAAASSCSSGTPAASRIPTSTAARCRSRRPPSSPKGRRSPTDGMKDHVTPRALETDEIPAIVEDYRQAAAVRQGRPASTASRSIRPTTICSNSSSATAPTSAPTATAARREPAALPARGGEAVVDVWGGDRVGIRISPATTVPGETPLDTIRWDLRRLRRRADRARPALRARHRGRDPDSRATPTSLDFPALRRRFKGAYIANNSYDAASSRSRRWPTATPTCSALGGRSSPTRTCRPAAHRRTAGRGAEAVLVRRRLDRLLGLAGGAGRGGVGKRIWVRAQ